MNISPKDLLDAGVHFGHQTRRWNPKSKPFIYDHRHGISIIDLEKTYTYLERATTFVEELVASGKDLLFVGTKKQAQEVVREAATSCQMPFCANRWMGGALTNFTTIKSSLAKYKKFLDMENTGELSKLPGKEAAAIRRQMARMNRNFEGLLDVDSLPAAMFVVDIRNEAIAVNEASRLNIPVVALVDTNSDPSLVDYPIPGNDDAVKSIRIITEVVMEAVQNGLARRPVAKAQKGSITPLVREQFFEETDDVEVTLPDGYGEETPPEATPKAPEVQMEAAPVADPDAPAAPEEAPKAEEAPAEAPIAEAPEVGEPKPEAPGAEEPKAEAPEAEEPKVEEPEAEEPKPEAPAAEEPKPEAPAAEEPKVEEPAAEKPGSESTDSEATEKKD